MAFGGAEPALAALSVITGLDPASYARALFHQDSCVWPERNCYVDLWIEVLHALQLETRAIMPFVLAGDFHDDQWTFLKPTPDDLFELYGLEVQELNVWRPLLEHAQTHLAAGRLISTEADAFWLPDVAGTDYRRHHVKTTIVFNFLDVAGERLGYFHNAGYYELQGEDFRQIFRTHQSADPAALPLFAEFIDLRHLVRRDAADLGRRSVSLLRRYLARRPSINPVARFAEALPEWLPRLRQQGMDQYHLWAFGGIRQIGASLELLAGNLQWLNHIGLLNSSGAAAAFGNISSGCKTLILKGARAVATGKQAGMVETCQEMAAIWDSAIGQLESLVAAGE